MLMEVLSAFKFQSDSINTRGDGVMACKLECIFKFQSDSINTYTPPLVYAAVKGL